MKNITIFFDRYSLVILIFYILMVYFYGLIHYNIPPYNQYDLMHYLNMSSLNPLNINDIDGPFCYRILGPYLSGLFGKFLVDDITAYRFLTICFGFCSVLLSYHFFIFMGIKPVISMVSTIMFMFNKYYFGFLMWDYFQLNDLLNICFIIILYWCMYRQKWMIFGITFLMGCISRETVLIMIPVTLLYLFEKKAVLNEIIFFCYSIVPGIICFLWLRLNIEPANDFHLLSSFIQEINLKISIEASLRKILLSLFPFSFIWLIFFKDSIKFIKGRNHIILYILLVFLSTMFGVNHERLMNPIFIVFYWFLADILQKYNIISFCKILILLTIGFLSSFHHEMGRYVFFGRGTYICLVVLFTFLITFLFYSWQHNRVPKLAMHE